MRYYSVKKTSVLLFARVCKVSWSLACSQALAHVCAASVGVCVWGRDPFSCCLVPGIKTRTAHCMRRSEKREGARKWGGWERVTEWGDISEGERKEWNERGGGGFDLWDYSNRIMGRLLTAHCCPFTQSNHRSATGLLIKNAGLLTPVKV